MRIIALMNQKGGVGKTTTTASLGAALAETGKKVCLIDLDPQAHLTINWGVEPTAGGISLYDVLCGDAGFHEAVRNVHDNVALLPSSIDLAAAEIELVSVLGRETILKEKLESALRESPAPAQLDFDFILLDCPPSLGLLTINALGVASEVIIPMQPHFLALQGFAKLLETVQLVNKRMNPGLKVSGIVLTLFDAQTKLTTEVVAELENFITSAKSKPLPWADARIFQTRIRRNIKLAECPSFGQTIMQYGPSSHGASDYRALAVEVIEMSEPQVAPMAIGSNEARVETNEPTIRTTEPRSARTEPKLPSSQPVLATNAPQDDSAAPVATHEPDASLEVVLNTAIDQSKLAAARLGTDRSITGVDDSPDEHDAEVAA